VAALGKLVVVNEPGVGFFGPVLRGQVRSRPGIIQKS
jgi:hypothetical protein